MTLNSGTKLGPYDIESLLGAGGMGEVYRARDARLNRMVAIKVLPKSFSADADRLQRFTQEARAAAALNHPNILSIFDIGEEQGAPYIVSELLEGTTLREQVRNGPMPVRKAIDCALQTARGLAAAHDKGIVHRDLKPENIFVTDDGRVKILDFGLAKLTRPEATSERRRHADRAGEYRARAGDGDGGVYVSRAGARESGGSSGGHFCVWIDSVRDAFGQACVSRRKPGGDDERDSEGRAGRAFGDGPEYSGAAGADRAALPGEESGAAVSVGGRRGVQPGGAVGQLGGNADERAGGGSWSGESEASGQVEARRREACHCVAVAALVIATAGVAWWLGRGSVKRCRWPSISRSHFARDRWAMRGSRRTAALFTQRVVGRGRETTLHVAHR